MNLSKIHDHFQEVAERQKRYDPINRPHMSAKMEDAENNAVPRGVGFGTQYAFTLRMTLEVTYWANHAQKSDARRNAEKVLQDALYRGVVGRLVQIRSMLDSADRDTVQLAITELIGELRP